MGKCCVCNVHFRPARSRSFHRFPNDPDLRKKWMEIIGLSEPINLQNKFVCSDHFNDSCFLKQDKFQPIKKLNLGALPTISKDSCQNQSDICPSKELRDKNVPVGASLSAPQTLNNQAKSKTGPEIQVPRNVKPKKRKYNIQNGRRAKRFKFMDLFTREDFTSDGAWDMFVQYKMREAQAARVPDKPAPDPLRNQSLGAGVVNGIYRLQLCRICLATDCKMYSMWEYELVEPFKQLTGLKIELDDGLPTKLCFECAHRLDKCKKFREKCITTDKLMLKMSNYKTLTFNSLSLNREKYNLTSTFTIKTLSYQVPEPDAEKINVKEELEDLDFEEDFVQTQLDVKDEMAIDDLLPTEEFSTELDIVDKKDDVKFTDNDSLNKITDEFYESDIEEHSFAEKLSNETEKGIEEILNEKVNTYSKISLNDDPLINSKELVNSDVKNRRQTAKAANTSSNIEAKNKTVVVRKKRDRRKAGAKDRITVNVGFKEKFTFTALNLKEQTEQMEKMQESKSYRLANIQCEKCFRGFMDKNAYENHLKRHSDISGQFECDLCKLRFRDKVHLRNHIKKHTHMYSCNMCNYKTCNRTTAVAHFKWHKGTRYTCPHCPEVYERISTYFSHLRIKHPSDFTCDICGYSFISKKGVESHKRLSHKVEDSQQIPDDVATCDSCNIRFVSAEAYNTHLQVSAKHASPHEGTSSNQKTYNERNHGKRKQRKREKKEPNKMKIRPITCEQCGVELPSGRAYRHHFEREHPGVTRTKYFTNNTKTRMCEICGKLFICKALLNDHMLQHTGHMYKCDICDKEFKSKQGMNFHKKSHNSRAPCPVCGKFFSNIPNMKRHSLLHTGLRPFKCHACTKSFTNKHALKLHYTYSHLKKPWPKKKKGVKKGIKKIKIQDDCESEIKESYESE